MRRLPETRTSATRGIGAVRRAARNQSLRRHHAVGDDDAVGAARAVERHLGHLGQRPDGGEVLARERVVVRLAGLAPERRAHGSLVGRADHFDERYAQGLRPAVHDREDPVGELVHAIEQLVVALRGEAPSCSC